MSGLKSEAKRGMGIDIRPYVCGGLAAMVAESFTFPMDTAKTRLQIQGTSVQYKGAFHTIRTVISEEGILALYKGLSPALLRQAVYGTIKFGMYYTAKDVYFALYPNNPESNIVNLCCAIFAGSVSSAIANPTDLVKVRMQAKSLETYGNLLSVFVDIKRKEGVVGLWRGVCPTAQRSGLVAGVQLPVYDWTRLQLARRAIVPEGACCNLTASLLAGLSACAASNPVDVIRTRLMVQRKFLKGGKHNPGNKIYTSSFECCVSTVRSEGFAALYKGFLPSFGRMGPWNVVFFLVYEKLKFVF